MSAGSVSNFDFQELMNDAKESDMNGSGRNTTTASTKISSAIAKITSKSRIAAGSPEGKMRPKIESGYVTPKKSPKHHKHKDVSDGLGTRRVSVSSHHGKSPLS